ncbi:MAG: S41 family peptidase [Bryobacteraceae bacterium]
MTADERKTIFEKVDALVRQKFFDPKFNGRNWPALVQDYRDLILSASDDNAFESQVNRLLAELGTSHTSLFHKSTPVPSRNSINATFKSWETADGARWIFQDVQPGGPADLAGARPGDVLLTINDREFRPPQPPEFRMHSCAALTLVHRNGATRELKVELQIPKPKHADCPYAEPRSALAKEIEAGVGYLKVSMFPGVVGIDFAHEVDGAIAGLGDCKRLIVDLRGNPGGGIGALRLMSYLTPDRIPVGYSLTRNRAERGYRRESLPQFRGIPDQKWQLPFLAARLLGRDQSIVVVTEGKGPQKFHDRIVLLVNEHTAGSAEMVAGFARENRLAKIVGAKTAGRLLGGKGFKVGENYILMLPVGAYLSWNGHRFEGSGVTPDVQADWSPGDSDKQLERALEMVRDL